MLRKIFLYQLPMEIKLHVAANGETNSGAIASIADGMVVAEHRLWRTTVGGWHNR